jgi:hypothetical protein
MASDIDPREVNASIDQSVTQGRILDNPSKLINYVRAYLRDYPELNRLLSGQETSDRQIAQSIVNAVDDWNSTPPLLTPVSIQTFPSLSLLLQGSVIYLLQSVAMLQLRNHLSYSDGQGQQISTSDKSPQLMAWANLMASQYESKKFRLKKALNITAAMNRTAVLSEYTSVNGFFDGIL